MFDELLETILDCLKGWVSWIQIDEISREEAARLFLEKEITIKYQPTIIEFDRKPSSIIPETIKEVSKSTPVQLHTIQGESKTPTSWLLRGPRHSKKPTRKNWRKRGD